MPKRFLFSKTFEDAFDVHETVTIPKKYRDDVLYYLDNYKKIVHSFFGIISEEDVENYNKRKKAKKNEETHMNAFDTAIHSPCPTSPFSEDLSSPPLDPTSPKYDPNASPKYKPTTPVYDPTSPKYVLSSPRFDPNASLGGYSPTSPVYTFISPTYHPTSPKYVPSSPKYKPTTSAYGPSSPVYNPPDLDDHCEKEIVRVIDNVEEKLDYDALIRGHVTLIVFMGERNNFDDPYEIPFPTIPFIKRIALRNGKLNEPIDYFYSLTMSC